MSAAAGGTIVQRSRRRRRGAVTRDRWRGWPGHDIVRITGRRRESVVRDVASRTEMGVSRLQKVMAWDRLRSVEPRQTCQEDVRVSLVDPDIIRVIRDRVHAIILKVMDPAIGRRETANQAVQAGNRSSFRHLGNERSRLLAVDEMHNRAVRPPESAVRNNHLGFRPSRHGMFQQAAGGIYDARSCHGMKNALAPAPMREAL